MAKNKRTKKASQKTKAKLKKRTKIKRTEKPVKELSQVHRTRMRIFGIGGGGSSIVSEIAPKINRVDFIVANTDNQALKEAARQTKKLSFGNNITHGLGCGMDPRLGYKSAEEESGKIIKSFSNIDLAVMVSSLGGGTGSGATPEFARIAKESEVITLGIFTLPFKFEGGKRAQIAKAALERITPLCNVVSIIPNENIFKIIDKNTPLKTAFSLINEKLSDNLRGLIEMVYVPGLINIDFADLRAILEGKGRLAYLNTSLASGPNRADEAVKDLLKSPLNEYTIQGAERILFNITAAQGLEMREVENISKAISDHNKKAKIIFGVSQDNSYKDKLRITLLAVGVGKESAGKKIIKKVKIKPIPEPEPEPEPKPVLKPKRKPVRKKKTQKKIVKTAPKKKPKMKHPAQKKKIEEVKQNSLKKESEEIRIEENKIPTRKNALDLRKEAEEVEEEIIDKEKRWDIPAFLRKREDQ